MDPRGARPISVEQQPAEIMRRSWLALPTLAAAAIAAAAVGAPSSDARRSTHCGQRGYSYAGYESVVRAHGVSATVVPLATPHVQSGHVAAWVGLGGPRLGPNGTDEWIQVGMNAFPGGESTIYYEVTRPNSPRIYQEVDPRVTPGERHWIAVLEMAYRKNFWRVWVDGKPVSKPIYLPASSGRWRPIATAETWDGFTPACNGFRYRFERVQAAMGRGGAWRRFVSGHRFQDPGYRVQRLESLRRRATRFLALRVGFQDRR